MVVVVAAGFVSCSDDIEMTTLLGFNGMEPREIAASSSEVIMDGYDEEAEAVTFTWGGYQLSASNPEYGVPDKAITMFLEMSKTPDFARYDSVQVEGYKKTFKQKELNLILIRLDYEPWVTAPLYVRVRYVLAENIPYQYSNTIQVLAAPYGIHFNRMDLLASDKQRVIGTIYSPTENGIYQGFVAGTSDWMNFYLRSRDNTIYGCVPDNAYNMTSDEDNMWNFWLQNVADCYFVTANVNTMTWGTERINKMQLTSNSGKSYEMKYDRRTNSYTAVVTTTAVETFTARTTSTTRYDIEFKDGTEGNGFTFADIVTISDAGTWLVTLSMDGEQPTATYAESSEQPQETYPNVLLMVNQDNWNVVKCRMFAPKDDGVCMGFYRTVEGWENFLLATEDKAVIWGSMPGSQYVLDSSSDHWNLWGDEKVGLYLYTANLAESTWNQRYINRLVVRGTINGDFVDLVYDMATKTWQADITVTDPNGWGVKILLDDNWDDVLVRQSDGKLGYNNGGDIMLPAPGNYTLKVNLYDFENMTYEFIAK